MYLKFWVKTFIHDFFPGGYGYYRYLHEFRDTGYVHDRDKHPVRNKHHGKGGWKEQKKEGLRYRDYATYEEYVTHQKQKFDEMLKVRGGFTKRDIVSYRLKFYQRFRVLPEYLSKSAHILCAGARQGTEVEVLHDLGFKNAYGIDLNPGPENKLVRKGDFMCLENADSSLDMIYSNCIDHAFDLDTFFREHSRVLKPNGYVLYDIALQGVGAFEAAEWESDEIVFLLMLRYFKTVIMVNTERSWKWILLQGKRDA